MIPQAPETYNRSNEQQLREELRRADGENFKKGRDVRLEQGERLIMRSPNGTQWIVSVSNAGAIVVTAL